MEDYEKITKEIIKIIKGNSDLYELEPEMIDVTTSIIEITDEWIVYLKIISDIENFFNIEFPDDENLCNLHDNGTIRGLSDFTAEIIGKEEINMEMDENACFIDEDENDNKEITELNNMVIDKLLEDLERRAKEARLSEAALNKIRWNEKDKDSYKNPL